MMRPFDCDRSGASLSRARRAAALAVLLALLPSSARAASILVTTTADDNVSNLNCTLREAVLAANSNAPVDACSAGSGSDVITLPAGIYTLAIAGRNEDAAATGDLDLTGSLEIAGAGAADTTIDGAGLDRIFHVLPGSVASLHDLTMRNGTVDSSGPTYNGGALLAVGATTTIERSVVETSSANYGGGGVAGIDGTLTISDSTIRGNHCNYGTAQVGCGLLFQGTTATDAQLFVDHSLVTANHNENGFGFAVFVEAQGDGDTIATILDSTISDNLGGTFMPTSSGGIRVEDRAGGGTGGALAYLGNTTIVGNTDVGAYAFANPGDSVRIDITSSILADNATYDCEGNVRSLGHNVAGDAVPPFNLTGRDCAFTAAGDQVVSDPMLAPLADNGGPTETRALLPGSPAIDAGHPGAPGSGGDACEADDQRGVTRFRCDAGAYDEGLPSTCPPAPQSGCTNVTAASFQLRDKNADGAGSGDKLQWKWKEAVATQLSDFGDPTAATDYSVCVYSNSGSTLALVASIPAASTCDGGACWKTAGDTGFKFKDRNEAFDGIGGVKLKADASPGKASANVRGLGDLLQYSGLPLPTDVTVQLLRSDSPTCWQSVLDLATVRDSSDEVFRAKSD